MSDAPASWWQNHGGRLQIALLVSLTLGLAPFFPEPHLLGKVRWVVGSGGDGMQPMDVFDLVLHGLPWVWLLVELVGFAVRRATRR